MRCAKSILLAGLALMPCIVSAQAPAQDATSPASAPTPSDTAVVPARVEGVATVGDLARVMSQRLLAEERKKLVAAQRESGGDPALSAEGGAPVAGQGGVSRRPYESPVVVGIHGSASSPYALVRVSDATVLSVRAGDSLPGGWTVQRVAPDGVTVRGEGGQRSLGFAAAVEPVAQPSSSARR